MNSGLRLWLPILLVSSVLALGLAPSAKADAIYSLDFANLGFSWSFEVPAIITTPGATITSFQTVNIVPGGFVDTQGCTTIDSVVIEDPTNGGRVTSVCNGIGSFDTFPALDHFGTFTGPAGATLTISPSGVPEPSSLLLLAGG